MTFNYSALPIDASSSDINSITFYEYNYLNPNTGENRAFDSINQYQNKIHSLTTLSPFFK